jgi:hypothetical protein
LEDKIHPDLRKDIGVNEALDLLYDTYAKSVDYIQGNDYLTDEQRKC